jgi:hypothetical protein
LVQDFQKTAKNEGEGLEILLSNCQFATKGGHFDSFKIYF